MLFCGLHLSHSCLSNRLQGKGQSLAVGNGVIWELPLLHLPGHRVWGDSGLSRACLTAAALLLIDNSARMKGIVSGVCSTGDMLCSYQVCCISESAFLGLLLLVFVTASAYRGEIAVVCSHADLLGLSKPLICVFDPNCEWWDRCSPGLSRAE